MCTRLHYRNLYRFCIHNKLLPSSDYSQNEIQILNALLQSLDTPELVNQWSLKLKMVIARNDVNCVKLQHTCKTAYTKYPSLTIYRQHSHSS